MAWLSPLKVYQFFLIRKLLKLALEGVKALPMTVMFINRRKKKTISIFSFIPKESFSQNIYTVFQLQFLLITMSY